jgi:Ala-tRNA(Pro) deacylase
MVVPVPEDVMPATKLKNFLDEHGVSYETIRHSPTYTAQKTAASAHVPGKELAKTVMIRVDGRLAMAVLPAPMQIDFQRLSRALTGAKVELADEGEFRAQFPDCEVGAMPPFGNLYDLAVYADEHLTKDDQIAFNACTHTELIQLAYDDYVKLVQPTVLAFAAGGH